MNTPQDPSTRSVHSAPDVVVVGAGVIGLAIAWRSASRGARVVVVDADLEGRASDAAAGLLAPVTEAHFGEEALLRLNLASADAYPGFVRELEEATGLATRYRRTGTVMVARDMDENAVLQQVFRFQSQLGLEAHRLKARECRDLEPGLAPSIRGGVLVPGDHQIDNRALRQALLAACRGSRVVLKQDLVARVEVEGDRVRGVRTASGESLPCPRVVIAAGCWSSALVGVPDAQRVRPVKGQVLHLRTRDGRPLCRHNIRGLDVYVLSRADGRVVVGATVEEQGFDPAVTAEGVYTLLRDAYELLPGILDLELVDVAVGFRPGTPDNAPILGASAVEGLVFATGHYRNGILLTPITADAIAQLLATGEEPELIRPFSPRRLGASHGATR